MIVGDDEANDENNDDIETLMDIPAEEVEILVHTISG